MTILLISLIILVILAIFTGAFFLSNYVVKLKLDKEQLENGIKVLYDREKIELIIRNEYLERNYQHVDDKEKIEIIMRKELLETNYKIAEDYIKGLEDRIESLTYTVDQQNYESQVKNQRVIIPRIWNPNDMLNSEERS